MHNDTPLDCAAPGWWQPPDAAIANLQITVATDLADRAIDWERNLADEVTRLPQFHPDPYRGRRRIRRQRVVQAVFARTIPVGGFGRWNAASGEQRQSDEQGAAAGNLAKS
jgi:hypothetical protein